MRLLVAEQEVFAHTGGVDPAAWADGGPVDPVVVLVHGAGNDHSVWRHQTPRLANLGCTVVAVDLPGHGRSAGPALDSIEAMAGWIEELLDALGAATATVVGHSMGSLIAVATAARLPDRVRRIGLVATAPQMPVHPQLLAAALAVDPLAIDLIVGWSHTHASRDGGHHQAGVGTTQQTRRLLERNLDVLGTDLAACAAWDAAPVAATLDVDALVIAGSHDRMTPARAGTAMARLLRVDAVVVPDGSHASLYDHPDVVNAALVPWVLSG